MHNPLVYSGISASFLKWCRNLILFKTVIYRDTACGSPHRTVTTSPDTGVSVSQSSLLALNQSGELFVHISQEVIDLSVFTVCLKIEARKLESHPAKHVL